MKVFEMSRLENLHIQRIFTDVMTLNTDLLHMDSHNDANEDPDRGDNAQD